LITAITRAKLIEAIASARDPASVIMIATDGLYSTEPLPLECSAALGSWEETIHNSDMFIVQSGVYWFLGEDARHKTRGVAQSVLIQHQSEIRKAWFHYLTSIGDPPPPAVPIRLAQFIGYRQALAEERGRRTAEEMKSPLRSAGTWRTHCNDPACDHQNDCSPVGVSFDWRLKRERNIIDGLTVRHWPITGRKREWSTPYNAIRERNELNSITQIADNLPDMVTVLGNE
jgi:hypothetical protein